MDKQAFLQEVKKLLSEVYGDRLKGVVLYGSEARGEAKSDSDIDILVLLKGPVNLGHDLKIIIKTLYELQLSVFRPISAHPVDYDAYLAGACSLFRNARREGLQL